MNEKLTEEVIVDKIINFMINKEDGNWHEEKVQKSDLHKHGVDIKLVGGKRNSEYFFIECKGKSYAKSARSVNREGWLNALGQIITRMDVKRYSMSKNESGISGINHEFLKKYQKFYAYTYLLDSGEVKYFTTSKFGKVYTKDVFS